MADGGDAFAQVQLGKRLQAGDGSAADAERAFASFQRAAEAPNADGWVESGRCMLNKLGTFENESGAADAFRAAAEMGDVEGQFWLAHVLRFGRDVPRDEREAAGLLKQAADAGHALAANEYGRLLEHGAGVAQDVAEAVRYYDMSAQQACPEGMFNLADMKQHGRNVEKDVREALRLYRLAGDAGFSPALYAAFEMCKLGDEGFPPNHAMAARVAEAHAARGEFLGLIAWADALRNEIGVPLDRARAQALRIEAFSDKFVEDQLSFGYALDYGKGCQVDKQRAMELYDAAARNGNTHAMYNLACCYRDAAEPDQERAAKLFQKAADEGHDQSAYEFALCMQRGVGTRGDLPMEVDRYLRIATERGNVDAMTLLGEKKRDEEDFCGAIYWLEKAADKHHPPALTALAEFYVNGWGCDTDLNRARELCQEAVALGDPDAAELLKLCGG
jgi:TPR repeat protein